MQSLKEFILDSSAYDHKAELLEQWVVRKEKEIKSRVNLPPKNF